MNPSPATVPAPQQAVYKLLKPQTKRTKLTYDQLNILQSYFNIHSAPSEHEIVEISEQTGLQEKTVKNWFRNKAYKERQRDPNSPYNFSNPPSTSINMEEWEKTGRVEVRVNSEAGDDLRKTRMEKINDKEKENNKEAQIDNGKVDKSDVKVEQLSKPAKGKFFRPVSLTFNSMCFWNALTARHIHSRVSSHFPK